MSSEPEALSSDNGKYRVLEISLLTLTLLIRLRIRGLEGYEDFVEVSIRSIYSSCLEDES